MWILVGILLGFYLCLYLLAYIPGAVEALSNKPNRLRPVPERQDITKRDYDPSLFGFFTTVRPGQVKLIQRGGKFVCGILDYHRHMFKGELTTNDLVPRDSEYWEVIDTPRGEQDTHPIPFPIQKWAELWNKPQWLLYFPISILWWSWKRWIYNRTGYVFTGIYPFQVVRVYPMERFDRVTRSDGTVDLVRREDYSDHYRVAHFQYPARVARADTRDNLPVNVLLNEVAQVFNPHHAAYNTDDDWPTRFLGSVSNRVTMFTRPRPLDQVWTAQSPDTVEELSKFVTLGGAHVTDEERAAGVILTVTEGSTCAFGVKIIETQVLDISPSNASDEQQLGAPARSKAQRLGDEELAKGRAAYIREEGLALREHPHADIVVQNESMVRAAEAAGKNGGIVILGSSGQTIDAGIAAILKELRTQRGDTNNGRST